MNFYQLTGEQWFLLAHRELLLFTAVFFAVGVLDEIGLDLTYLWLRLRRRLRTPRVEEAMLPSRVLAGDAAIFIPTWQESAVIGPTIAHLLASWRHENLRLYIGCYRNDPLTIASVVAAARGDSRIRLVIHGADGPTSKADCLNRLYRALRDDEVRNGRQARMVVLHDAEDMVDPAALPMLDLAMWDADFVQLPVLALPQSNSRFIGSHYSDEFAEAHGKAMVVRDSLGAAVPGAGVGCAIARSLLANFGDEPFARQSLTEDYELGLKVAAVGGTGRFLRIRTCDGRLVGTRAFFPSRHDTSVRQKTRWMHGIALQGWDRLGWRGGVADQWMQMRDRRGPLAALLLAVAYLLIGLSAAGWMAAEAGLLVKPEYPPALKVLLFFNGFGLLWRAAVRALFTAREFGWREGLWSIPRIVVSNLISIMAGRRALTAYFATLLGAPVRWDKTDHSDHPAMIQWASPAKGAR